MDDPQANEGLARLHRENQRLVEQLVQLSARREKLLGELATSMEMVGTLGKAIALLHPGSESA
jgi:hypothetical protein